MAPKAMNVATNVTRTPALPSAFVEGAAVMAVWAGALVAEDVAIGFLWRAQFSGPWEIAQARHVVGPIALAALVPVAALVVGGWRLAIAASRGSRVAAGILAAMGALTAGALALGVTEGRHFASWTARGPFVLALVVGGAAAGRWGAPRVAGLARYPVALGLLGVATAIAGWTADSYVLPRLYPAFHLAMLAICLLGGGLAALSLRAGAPPPGRGLLASAAVVAVLAGVCLVGVPHAARALQGAANLRIVLVEHAPLMGRAVSLVIAFEPEGPAEAVGAQAVAPGEVARSLDWSGHDVVLVTVDALRADHVSAYGYGRSTTPNLDQLASEGTRFDEAYCPTPHTSYSLTSMMTGKYLRPLLALGLGEDSETWAQYLRRYGWRTGAFYPPAVFFIDEDRFTRLEDEHLGFEYAKVEFADPALREKQVAEYVDAAPSDRPLFLWVHFFEPHEPYVVHPEHVFSGGPSADVDAYDSEVATADDGIGRIVRLVRGRRPGAVVLVTADHGEEFGEHGGRYHGTTVYDEQVRVPLVVSGPGVRAGQRVATAVQTIDLLPTALSALGIPRPARLRGRDLGPLLAGDPKALDDGRAFTETDDYELLASGPDRLICQRRAAACALYRPAQDPLERRDLSAQDPQRFGALRALLREVARDHGRYESSGVSSWPEPLRRGLQGEADAAPDVAALLDDAEVTIRRKAAEVCFDLHAAGTAPQVRRAVLHDEDDEVRRWAALALARMGDTGEPAPPMVDALLKDPNRDWRRRAALALAERGDGRGCDEIASWWAEAVGSWQPNVNGEPPKLAMDLVHVRELVAATAEGRCKAALPSLCRALDDVRARPYLADALGTLGDDRARKPLLQALGTEPYVTTRPREARALLALGVHDWSAGEPEAGVHTSVTLPAGGARLIVLLSDPLATLDVSVDGVVLETAGAGAGADTGAGDVRAVELPPREPSRRARLDLSASAGGIVALWVIPLDYGPRRD
ncbi:MAG TPA: sulfatase-like hydrolase/transferase [Polyangiaceae bacterium]|nr:sulfatase-like hydrolase/transferase [Polyangiaceae bacterium]